MHSVHFLVSVCHSSLSFRIGISLNCRVYKKKNFRNGKLWPVFLRMSLRHTSDTLDEAELEIRYIFIVTSTTGGNGRQSDGQT